LGEFDLIRQYFIRPTPGSPRSITSWGKSGSPRSITSWGESGSPQSNTLWSKSQATVGIGDDAAIVPFSGSCAVAADMLVCGRHFFADDDPFSIGWKSMAVNLSDLAAMSAVPQFALLSIALPTADETWLAGFSSGLFACADQFDTQLIGGDTTKGPLTIAITVLGQAPLYPPLRCHAQIGDDIWVSGYPGLAAIGLRIRKKELMLAKPEQDICLSALQRPIPRVALGRALTRIANAMIDVSDGLLADLTHILAQSNVGAQIDMDRIVRQSPMASSVTLDTLLKSIAYGGDDYELCWTAPVSARSQIESLAKTCEVTLTRIGQITPNPGLQTRYDNQPIGITGQGFDHFHQD